MCMYRPIFVFIIVLILASLYMYRFTKQKYMILLIFKYSLFLYILIFNYLMRANVFFNQTVVSTYDCDVMVTNLLAGGVGDKAFNIDYCMLSPERYINDSLEFDIKLANVAYESTSLLLLL